MPIPNNINREKTLTNVRSAFPSLNKPENITKVIYAGLSLNAVDVDSARKRVELESEGATSYGVSLSTKIEILHIKKFKAPPFFQYHRPVPKPKTELERMNALKYERGLLYERLAEKADALRKVVSFLKMESGSTLADVKNVIEDGDSYKQIKFYDDIFKKALGEKEWHNEEYDYYWMGYRRRSARYWLTSKAHKLVVRK